jgi:large subunit ribosomal protein L10
MTTENPRAEKVAVVEEITAKLNSAEAVFITEYRGMSVGQLAALRRQLKPAGGEYKVYKNTLARFAAQNAGLDSLADILVGPSGMTFASGDIAATAKALRDASKANPLLIIKGGAMGSTVLSAKDVEALAELPSRETLLAMFAGALQAPLVKTAGLLQALPRNFAYGLKALIEQKEAA